MWRHESIHELLEQFPVLRLLGNPDQGVGESLALLRGPQQEIFEAGAGVELEDSVPSIQLLDKIYWKPEQLGERLD